MKKILSVPLGIAGFSVGTGLVGQAINSEPLQEAGATAAKFVKPAVNIAAGGLVVNMLRSLNKNKVLKPRR